MLAQEARVDHLQLAYRSAAEKYAEAASLVASFDPESRIMWLFAQANECFCQGDEFGDNASLVDAITLYRQCLDLSPRDRVPLDWARTQNNLGNALWTLGERESGTARLEEAVSAYRAALEEWTRERVPLEWATTQNNLGNALSTLGERESGTARLEEAVAAYRAALEEWTRERVPLDWARTQNNLGDALCTPWRAGERDGAARGGGCGLSRGAGGVDPRARAARLGDDAEQSRQRALQRLASGRAGRRGSRRRLRPIARR